MSTARFSLPLFTLALFHTSLLADEDPLVKQAETALKKATGFFRDKVATKGGYLWLYSADLTKREGEGKASATTVWVQPPGTPSVGLAYLRAYEATKERYYLEAARDVGMALVNGQLQSGGWDYRIEFEPKERKRYAYRMAPNNPRGRNVTTLDDNTTQEAVRLLMNLDKALKFEDKVIHATALIALDSLLKAQYPNGAWPQRYSDFPDPEKYPVKKAGYPKEWSRTYPRKDYSGFYTLNDNTLSDVIDVMLDAAEVYQGAKYRRAGLRGGDFLLLAQMPDPQPIWAQQYNLDMHPAWARKFEPASVTGGESQGAMRALLQIYRKTGEKKYLKPLPRAIAYLRSVQLSDNRVARFYELKTSKPLYFTKDYQLTYSDKDMPTHYGFKTSNRVDAIEREYKRLENLDPTKLNQARPPSRVSSTLRNRAQRVIQAMDEQGRWLEKGQLRRHENGDKTELIISSRTFTRNLDTLSSYLKIALQAKE